MYPYCVRCRGSRAKVKGRCLVNMTENGVDNGTIIGTENEADISMRMDPLPLLESHHSIAWFLQTRQASKESQMFFWLEVAVKGWP